MNRSPLFIVIGLALSMSGCSWEFSRRDCSLFGGCYELQRRNVDGKIEVFDGAIKTDCTALVCEERVVYTSRQTGEQYVSSGWYGRDDECSYEGHSYEGRWNGIVCGDTPIADSSAPDHTDVLPGRFAFPWEG
jgi:hypothetical protein